MTEKLASQTSATGTINSLLQLSTGGTPFQVRPGPSGASASSYNQIPVNEMLAIHTKHNLSGKVAAGIATEIRTALGNRKAIEPGLKEMLTKSNHTLDSFFELKGTDLFQKSSISEEINRPEILVKDLDCFVQSINGFDQGRSRLRRRFLRNHSECGPLSTLQ